MRWGTRSIGWWRVLALGALGALGALVGANYRPTPTCVEMQEATKHEVCFQSDGVTLAGTVHLPKGTGPFPAVVLVHGSGKEARESDEYGAYLASHGLVVLTYDKRGVAQSGGRYCPGIAPWFMCFQTPSSVYDQLTHDASAAVNTVAQLPQVGKIGLWGFSQGGWVAPIAASLNPNIDFLVQLSAPAVTLREENYIEKLMGHYPEPLFPDAATIAAHMANAPKGFFYPQSYLEQLRIPSLWLYGGKDREIPVDASIQNLHTWKPDDPQVTIKVYPEADHNLRLPGEGGSPAFSINDVWITWVKGLPEKQAVQ